MFKAIFAVRDLARTLLRQVEQGETFFCTWRFYLLKRFNRSTLKVAERTKRLRKSGALAFVSGFHSLRVIQKNLETTAIGATFRSRSVRKSAQP